MDLAVLAAELTGDPLARGYAAMSDVEAAASLNAANRVRVRSSMPGDEIFQQTDTTEFSSLTAAKQQMWVSFCARDSVDPRGAANIAFVQFLFGAGSTVSSLNAARNETVSRAVELGLGFVGQGDVEDARQ